MIKQSSIVLLAALSLVACGNSGLHSGDVYRAGQANTVRSVSFGTVQAVRPIQIQTNERSQGAMGAIGGAVIGGILGNSVGGGTGNTLATAGGAMAGAAVGSGIENRMSRVNGVELQILRDDGTIVAVPQEQGSSQFFVGQRVRLVGSNNSITVSPL